MICPTKNCTVLVVEDEAMVRADAVGTLHDNGYDVFDASNSDDALAFLNRGDDLSVLFSDIDMPGRMDGLGLAHEVRRRMPLAHIILTSGKLMPFDRDMPVRGRFVSKPYCIGDVSLLIDAMIGHFGRSAA